VTRILYLVTEDWYFYSHRLDLARAAKKAGYDVVVATQINSHADQIWNEGFELIPIRFPRSIRNLWHDLQTLVSIFKVYRNLQPDIIHHVSLKPVVYGSFVACLSGIRFTQDRNKPFIINALTGLGYVFTSDKFLARTIRVLILPVLRFLLGRDNTKLIVQNQDDLELLIQEGVISESQSVLIRGSGVDIEVFKVIPESDSIPLIILVARMLTDKGIVEFVNAARLVSKKGVKARFILVGDTDPENPSAIPERLIRMWEEEGLIGWWGKRDDMAEIYQQAHIVCLPSYREGLPKVLLEAAASGRAVVATDVPGCREIVENGRNGILVPVRDPEALAEAITRLIRNPEERREMGKYGRKLVEDNFTNDIIIRKTLDLYHDSLANQSR